MILANLSANFINRCLFDNIQSYETVKYYDTHPLSLEAAIDNDEFYILL